MNIKFISYDGKYPNLCSGVLTLMIDDEIVKFGHNYRTYDVVNSRFNDDNYESFWSSGGQCGFLGNYEDSYINDGAWIIYKDELPNWLQDEYEEIEDIFNDNVPYGCCGGCL